MPHDSNHATRASLRVADGGAPIGEPERHHRRTDWRLGGRTVRAWREGLLAVALISVGVGVVVFALLGAAGSSSVGALVGTAALWIGMLVPVVWGLSRSRPAGLLTFRALDLLWGVGLGLGALVVGGWVTGAAGGASTLPESGPAVGESRALWLTREVVGAAIVTPVLTELLFHGVILVSLYTALRRSVGGLSAGAAAALVSTATLVLAQAATAGIDTGQVIATSVLGATCALLVLLTGRIWGAVLVHVVCAAGVVAVGVLGALLA